MGGSPGDGHWRRGTGCLPSRRSYPGFGSRQGSILPPDLTLQQHQQTECMLEVLVIRRDSGSPRCDGTSDARDQQTGVSLGDCFVQIIVCLEPFALYVRERRCQVPCEWRRRELRCCSTARTQQIGDGLIHQLSANLIERGLDASVAECACDGPPARPKVVMGSNEGAGRFVQNEVKQRIVAGGHAPPNSCCSQFTALTLAAPDQAVGSLQQLLVIGCHYAASAKYTLGKRSSTAATASSIERTNGSTLSHSRSSVRSSSSETRRKVSPSGSASASTPTRRIRVPSAELLLIFSMLRCNTAISACFMSEQLRMWSTSAVVLRTGDLYSLLDASASPANGHSSWTA